MPTPLTDLAVGSLSGQRPSVYVRDITLGHELVLFNETVQDPYPASVVKLMTLLLLREHHSSDWDTGTVTLISADVTQPYAGITVSFAGFQAGDVVTWEGLAYGLLVPSGGDAALAIARVIGDEIYAANGNTGTQGVPRFVEAMNAKAATLELGATFFDPFGGSQSGVTVRNVMSAKDAGILCATVMSEDVCRTISSTTTFGITITGANARTLTVDNVIAFFNGPRANPAGFKDARVLAGKSGSWEEGSEKHHNLVVIWRCPAGYDVVISTMSSGSDLSRMLDQRGIMYMLLKEFPYLNDGNTNGDPDFPNVKLLIGADVNPIIDESLSAQTLVISGITKGTRIIGNKFSDNGSDGAMLSSSGSDDLHVVNNADLQVTAADATIEMWFSGPGAAPGTGVEQLFGNKLGTGQREWTLNYFNGGFNFFSSSDGSNWISQTVLTLGTYDREVFFNGAPRHISFVHNTGVWSVYFDGEKMANTVSVGTVFQGTAPFSIYLNGLAAIGRFDDFRFTKGTARYTDEMVSLTGRKFPRTTLSPPPPENGIMTNLFYLADGGRLTVNKLTRLRLEGAALNPSANGAVTLALKNLADDSVIDSMAFTGLAGTAIEFAKPLVFHAEVHSYITVSGAVLYAFNLAFESK